MERAVRGKGKEGRKRGKVCLFVGSCIVLSVVKAGYKMQDLQVVVQAPISNSLIKTQSRSTMLIMHCIALYQTVFEDSWNEIASSALSTELFF